MTTKITCLTTICGLPYSKDNSEIAYFLPINDTQALCVYSSDVSDDKFWSPSAIYDIETTQFSNSIELEVDDIYQIEESLLKFFIEMIN